MIPTTFRAQSLADGVFYYGTFLGIDTNKGTESYICFPNKNFVRGCMGFTIEECILSIQVDPKTLGMCTGLKDCTPWEELSEREKRIYAKDKDDWDGFYIYDGDVLDYVFYEGTDRVQHCKGLVYFDTETMEWRTRWVLSVGGEPLTDLLVGEGNTWERECEEHHPKIVGNIHDDKKYAELFKVGEFSAGI